MLGCISEFTVYRESQDHREGENINTTQDGKGAITRGSQSQVCSTSDTYTTYKSLLLHDSCNMNNTIHCIQTVKYIDVSALGVHALQTPSPAAIYCLRTAIKHGTQSRTGTVVGLHCSHYSTPLHLHNITF